MNRPEAPEFSVNAYFKQVEDLLEDWGKIIGGIEDLAKQPGANLNKLLALAHELNNQMEAMKKEQQRMLSSTSTVPVTPRSKVLHTVNQLETDLSAMLQQMGKDPSVIGLEVLPEEVVTAEADQIAEKTESLLNLQPKKEAHPAIVRLMNGFRTFLTEEA